MSWNQQPENVSVNTDFRNQQQAQSLEHQQEQTPLQPIPFVGQAPFSLTLPIPAPYVYSDNYYHPHFPNILPPIVNHEFVDPFTRLTAYPQPVGQLPPHQFNLLGATLHDFGYVNNHPEKLFTKYMLWYIELNDHFFRLICPSDLNDAPCEWDELQGGCPMLRLCQVRLVSTIVLPNFLPLS